MELLVLSLFFGASIVNLQLPLWRASQRVSASCASYAGDVQELAKGLFTVIEDLTYYAR